MYRFFILLFFVAWFPPLPATAAEDGEARNLFTLGYAQIEQAVGHAIADRGVAEKIVASIHGKQGDAAYAYRAPLTADVRGLRIDAESRRWSANILAVSESGEVVTAFPAAGRYEALVELPVLKRGVKSGEVITSDNIEIRDVPQSQARSDAIGDLAGLVGKTPLHYVSAARPVRAHEINLPPTIRKNNVVQMHYMSPGMEIIASGQALEDGANGQVITIKNLTSKKIVQAMVQENGSVIVSPPQPIRASTNPTLGDLYATN